MLKILEDKKEIITFLSNLLKKFENIENIYIPIDSEGLYIKSNNKVKFLKIKKKENLFKIFMSFYNLLDEDKKNLFIKNDYYNFSLYLKELNIFLNLYFSKFVNNEYILQIKILNNYINDYLNNINNEDKEEILNLKKGLFIINDIKNNSYLFSYSYIKEKRQQENLLIITLEENIKNIINSNETNLILQKEISNNLKEELKGIFNKEPNILYISKEINNKEEILEILNLLKKEVLIILDTSYENIFDTIYNLLYLLKDNNLIQKRFLTYLKGIINQKIIDNKYNYEYINFEKYPDLKEIFLNHEIDLNSELYYSFLKKEKINIIN